MKKAIYPGSFDPITIGHLDIIHRSLQLVDELIIAVALNDPKNPLFPAEKRLKMIKSALQDTNGKISVEIFDCLLIDFARQRQASVVIKGLRAISDFEYEFQMALMNRSLDKDIETLFLMASVEYAFVSSRMVKEICRLGGDVAPFVPKGVKAELENILRGSHET
jgi:pantetheine-phosphate adenylyltransferase